MIRRAFTLVELLVVISIIGLLSTIAITQMSSSREKARIARGLSYEGSVYRAVGDDLVSQWDLNDCSGTTAADTSGGGNAGTLTAGASWSTNTPSGQGCSIAFNGTAGCATVPYIGMTSASQTYSLWFNTATASLQNVLSLRSTLIRVSSTQVGWWPDVQSSPVYVTKTISLNVWHQLVIDQNGTTYNMYLDGGLISSGTALAINNANYTNGIGCYGSSIFSGLIDDVRVFNRSLTSKEAWRLYVEEAPQHGFVAMFNR
jgi:prepilin-type N-terminal cleavage/methylation domain-containing protein